MKSKAMSFCLTVFGLLCHHDPLHKSRPSLYVGCSILESVQFQRNAQRISLLDPEIKNYASSLYEKALRDSVKQFHQERSEYLARGARSSSVSLLSGPGILGIVQQHVGHIERCMSAVLESYQRAFADANQTPTEDDFTRILEEAQRAREQQIKNSRSAVGRSIASSGSSRLPPGAEESALGQITTSSGQGHDRVLREWKI